MNQIFIIVKIEKTTKLEREKNNIFRKCYSKNNEDANRNNEIDKKMRTIDYKIERVTIRMVRKFANRNIPMQNF